MVDLPLNGRNAADLTRLGPGTINANGHGTQQGTSKQIPGNESISVNGKRTDQIAYNLDGDDNQDLMTNTNDPFPFPDALQEFSVQTVSRRSSTSFDKPASTFCWGVRPIRRSLWPQQRIIPISASRVSGGTLFLRPIFEPCSSSACWLCLW